MAKWICDRGTILLVAALILGGCTSSQSERAALPNFEQVAAVQDREDWCWAACAEMALKYNGVDGITQRDLVARFKDGKADQRANVIEIVEAMALSPQADPDQNGAKGMPNSVQVNLASLLGSGISTAKMYTSRDSAIEDFAQNHPVVVGLNDYDGMEGHIVFLTAVEFRRKTPAKSGFEPLDKVIESGVNTFDPLVGNAKFDVVRIEFFDPRPLKGGVVIWNAQQADRHVAFWISRRHAQEIIDQAKNTLQLGFR